MQPTAATSARSSHEVSTRGRRFPPEVLSDREFRTLLDACGLSPIGLRNRALLVVMYRSGLRVREAVSLHAKDLDLDAGVVRVLWAKGGRSRTVGIDPAAATEVARWLAARAALRVPPGSPLFCGPGGRAITPGYIRHLLPGLARLAGIAKRVHAHGFRHTHAAQLRAEGVDVAIISRQLGHRSILTTIRYLDHLNPTAVIDAMRKREW